MSVVGLKPFLDDLLERRGPRLDRDPLGLVRPYRDPRDREAAGLVAAGLAFGRVEQVLRSVRTVLDVLGRRGLSRAPERRRGSRASRTGG